MTYEIRSVEDIDALDRKWTLESRAREIAEFLGIPEDVAVAKLSRGFGELHNEVTADFRRCNPRNDEQLLEWYRTTEAYICELTAYHLDEGFNYSGMCGGIIDRLNDHPGEGKVLCLGDGIGDLSLAISKARLMLSPYYHDLAGSTTARFAAWRFEREDQQVPSILSDRWDFPATDVKFDAIVSLDFLEHVTDLPHWVNAIYSALKPGGLFVAQNGFDCGSGPNGSIPMHLSRNDKYAHATPETNGLALWDHLLFGIGFRQLGSNWYQKPV